MLVVVVFAVFAVSGCAAPAEWHGDSRFTVEERAAIEAGEAWLAQHAGRAPATFDWTYEVTSDYRLDHTIRRERGPLPDGQTATGLCAGSTIYLDPIGDPKVNEHMTIEVLPGLAAHEMAHCELGFVDGYRPNDPPTDGIMRVLLPMRWTSAEDAQCAASPACMKK